LRRAAAGILTTMRATRQASLEELIDSAAPRLAALLGEGVTTIEIKSGYGLTLADEAKMLRAARALGERFPGDREDDAPRRPHAAAGIRIATG
jgi:imidazolonepropionase